MLLLDIQVLRFPEWHRLHKEVSEQLAICKTVYRLYTAL